MVTVKLLSTCVNQFPEDARILTTVIVIDMSIVSN